MTTHDIGCPGSEDLAALHDGELGEADRARVEAHVGACAACAGSLERLRRTSQLLAALPREGASEDLVRDVARRATGSARPRSWNRFVVPLASAAAMLVGIILLSRIVGEQQAGSADPRLASVEESAKTSTAARTRLDGRLRSNEVAQPSLASARDEETRASGGAFDEDKKIPAARTLGNRLAGSEVASGRKDDARQFAPEPPAEAIAPAGSGPARETFRAGERDAPGPVAGSVAEGVASGVVGGVAGGRASAVEGSADAAAADALATLPAASPATAAAAPAHRGESKAEVLEKNALAGATREEAEAERGAARPGAAPPRDQAAVTLGDDLQEKRGSDASASMPRRITSDMAAPILIERVDPVHPPEARRARLEGEVVLECVVDERGAVKLSRIVESVPGLDQAAIDAVQRWKYRPAFLDGRPQAVYLVIRIAFDLP